MKPSYSGGVNYGFKILIGDIGIRIPVLRLGLFLTNRVHRSGAIGGSTGQWLEYAQART